MLALVAADGQTLELVTSAGYSPELEAPWRRVPLEGNAPLVEAARAGTDSWLPTATAFRARFPDVALMDAYQARAAVALVIDDRPVGALGFSFARPHTFTGVDRRYIHALASRCAQALERIQLTDQVRSARTKLAGAQARAVTAQRRAIAAQANAVRAREQANFLAEVSAMLAGSAKVEAVLERPGPRRPLLVERVDQARPEGLPHGDELLQQLKALDVGSLLRVPLASMTGILGTIVFAAHRPGRYTTADLVLAENLARRAALAVERAERTRRLTADVAAQRVRRPHRAG